MNHVERFVDTGFWLALVNRDDDHHEHALALAQLLDGPLITTDAVIVEVGNALSRRRWRHLGVRLLADITNDPSIAIVRVTPDLLNRAITLYAQHRDKEWGLTDCISFVVMREPGLHEALAVDHHFVQAGFRALLLE